MNEAINDTNPKIPQRNHELKSIVEENIDFWKNQREARKANPAPLVDTGITNLDEGRIFFGLFQHCQGSHLITGK